MEFLENDEIAEEAISVLRTELAAFERREAELETELATVQADMDDDIALVQQHLADADALIQSLSTRADESSSSCHKLRDKVNRLMEKIRRAKQIVKEFVPEDPETLRADLARYASRREKYENRRSDIQTEITSLEEKMRDKKEPISSPPLYYQILASYPHVTRPSMSSLQPVGWQGEDLEQLLQLNDYTREFLPKSCYLPYRVGWHPPHAVIFAPTHAFNHGTGSWGSFSISHGYDGKVYHLFLAQSSRLFYRGIYRFRRIEDHKFNDIRGIHSDERLDQILDFAIPRSSPSGDWRTLEGLIIDGVLPLECMLLECLGFDHDLYDALVRQYRMRKGYLRKGWASTDLKSDRRYR